MSLQNEKFTKKTIFLILRKKLTMIKRKNCKQSRKTGKATHFSKEQI